jgi:restriction system protein
VGIFDSFKGWMGESAIAAGLWMKLDDSVYRRIHNVIVPTQNGTTQIDHVLVSVFGIFVVETKDRDGWIFGAPD